jgi:hypothetical protein
MFTQQLVEQLQQLNHDDKLRAMQLLLNSVISEEAAMFGAQRYKVWSFYDAAGAAAKLAAFIEDEKRRFDLELEPVS